MCAPVLSGLDAAVQLPGGPADRFPGAAPPLPVSLPVSCQARRPVPPLFLDSIRPAFGIEDEADLPDALAALVARLRLGSAIPVDGSVDGRPAPVEA